MQHLKGVLAAVFAMVLVCGPLAGAAQTSPQAPAQTQQEATISGRATDSGGAPLSGVQVYVDGAVHRQATTDARGFYDITAPPGVYLISASKAGYDQAVQDLVLTPGQKVTNLNIIMAGTTLTSLRTIGTVRTSAGTRSIFNTSALSVTTMNTEAIVARVQPNLSKLVGELPGVSAGQNSGGRDPNSSWSVRGARTETKVTVDGHTVSTGTFGSYNAIFANSEIFDQVEVLKGAGINGVNAGESAFGTVNLRTRGFTGKNSFVATVSSDIFSSGHYFASIEHEFSPKFSVLVARSFNGFAGPDQGIPGPVLNTVNSPNASSPLVYTGLSLIKWQQPLSHPFTTTADLLKARFNFSQATSLTAEYLNLVGIYSPQGASYAFDYGPQTIAQCFNGNTGVAAGVAGCTPASVYNAPQQIGLIGTKQNLYSYFPNSNINNQEPQFSLEFKTSLRNDTIFLRPYLTEIRRNIDGTQENRQPGNGGSWYQVVNSANCTVQFSAPAPGVGGASGPCFSSADNYTTPYVNNVSAAVVPWFAYTTNAATCSAAAPCYTTNTSQQRNGLYGFGGPFSQPEFDKLGGVTFSWLHPVGENLYSLNADYSSDYTTKATSDISQLPAGCVAAVAPSGLQNTPTAVNSLGATITNPYYQPNCQIGGVILGSPGTVFGAGTRLPTNGVSIPPTWNRKLTLSLTGLWQITPKLQVGLGNYFTFEHLVYQFTDPAQIAAASSLKTPTGVSLSGAEPADASLLMGSASHVHYDPHVQAQFRLNDNVSLRGTAGSSITTPYASLVSGFGAFRPNTTATTDLLTLPNTALQPETTVAYDLGADIRAHDGSVFSFDVFNNNIHNVFVNVSQQAAQNIRPGFTTIQSQVVNGPDEQDFGLEATWQKAPRVGLGYFASATLQRAYYYGFSNNFYIGLLSAACPGVITNACYDKAAYQPIVNGKQLDGLGGYEDQIPYTKGKFELNYAFPHDRAYAAVGFVYNGNNNPYGTPSFATAYLNAKYNAGKHVTFGLAVENLLNYSNGYFNGQVINNAGFIPLGVKWNPFCNAGAGCLVNGPAQSFIYNSAVVIQPRNFYFTITDRL